MPVKTVPYQAPALNPTPIAFVGEAPSWEELQEGKPLVGPSGRVFNGLLRTAGLRREDYLVTNVFTEKAENNDVSEWLADEDKLEEARARLGTELRAFAPNVVVPLGGTALHAFTGRSQIQSFRGNVVASSFIGPYKLLPTLHPAFVLKKWELYPIVVGDFIKAAAEAEKGPRIVWPKKELYLEPQVKDVQAYAEKCKQADLVSVDIETGWGQILSIGIGHDANHAMCVPFTDFRKPNRSYWGSVDKELAVVLALKGLLESPVPKLGQNFGSYDVMWLFKRMGIKPMSYSEDTKLLHHALYAELPKDLEFLGAAYANQGAWKYMGRHSKEKRDQ